MVAQPGAGLGPRAQQLAAVMMAIVEEPTGVVVAVAQQVAAPAGAPRRLTMRAAIRFSHTLSVVIAKASGIAFPEEVIACSL